MYRVLVLSATCSSNVGIQDNGSVATKLYSQSQQYCSLMVWGHGNHSHVAWKWQSHWRYLLQQCPCLCWVVRCACGCVSSCTNIGPFVPVGVLLIWDPSYIQETRDAHFATNKCWGYDNIWRYPHLHHPGQPMIWGLQDYTLPLFLDKEITHLGTGNDVAMLL
jgi:hypothetical protein